MINGDLCGWHVYELTTFEDNDLVEMFGVLRRYEMKLNPLKCYFGIASGKFLDFIVISHGIEANPKGIKALREIKAPRTIKEVQSLNGKIAALSRLISRTTDKCIPFFEVIKREKRNFEWNQDCKDALQALVIIWRGLILSQNRWMVRVCSYTWQCRCIPWTPHLYVRNHASKNRSTVSTNGWQKRRETIRDWKSSHTAYWLPPKTLPLLPDSSDQCPYWPAFTTSLANNWYFRKAVEMEHWVELICYHLSPSKSNPRSGLGWFHSCIHCTRWFSEKQWRKGSWMEDVHRRCIQWSMFWCWSCTCHSRTPSDQLRLETRFSANEQWSWIWGLDCRTQDRQGARNKDFTYFLRIQVCGMSGSERVSGERSEASSLFKLGSWAAQWLIRQHIFSKIGMKMPIH